MRAQAAASPGHPRNLPRPQAATLQARRIRSMRALWRVGQAAVLCLTSLTWAGAADTVASIALYDAPDRSERLLEGARKQASLNLYTSLTVEDMAALNSAFEAKYAIRIRMWRAASDKVLQRVLSEARAGRHEVDIVETNAPPLESLHREAVLQAVRSPHHAGLMAAALPAHREWVGSRLNVFVQAYNTRLVSKAELPRSYSDLLDPRWKGRLAIEAGDDDWFAGVVSALGEAEGLRLFWQLVGTNGISLRP